VLRLHCQHLPEALNGRVSGECGRKLDTDFIDDGDDGQATPAGVTATTTSPGVVRPPSPVFHCPGAHPPPRLSHSRDRRPVAQSQVLPQPLRERQVVRHNPHHPVQMRWVKWMTDQAQCGTPE